jgi:hypothetical protein
MGELRPARVFNGFFEAQKEMTGVCWSNRRTHSKVKIGSLFSPLTYRAPHLMKVGCKFFWSDTARQTQAQAGALTLF